MAAEKNRVVDSSDWELAITRIFDAPRALVYKAWTEFARMSQWSAPHGFTITHNEGDLRPGGAWRSCMYPVEPWDYARALWFEHVDGEATPYGLPAAAQSIARVFAVTAQQYDRIDHGLAGAGQASMQASSACWFRIRRTPSTTIRRAGCNNHGHLV
jgi:hypothetical protein